MWALPTPGRGMIPLHPAHFLTARDGYPVTMPDTRLFVQLFKGKARILCV